MLSHKWLWGEQSKPCPPPSHSKLTDFVSSGGKKCEDILFLTFFLSLSHAKQNKLLLKLQTSLDEIRRTVYMYIYTVYKTQKRWRFSLNMEGGISTFITCCVVSRMDGNRCTSWERRSGVCTTGSSTARSSLTRCTLRARPRSEHSWAASPSWRDSTLPRASSCGTRTCAGNPRPSTPTPQTWHRYCIFVTSFSYFYANMLCEYLGVTRRWIFCNLLNYYSFFALISSYLPALTHKPFHRYYFGRLHDILLVYLRNHSTANFLSIVLTKEFLSNCIYLKKV